MIRQSQHAGILVKTLALAALVAASAATSSCSSGNGNSAETGTTTPPPPPPPPTLSGAGFPQEQDPPARFCPQDMEPDAASNTAVSVAFSLDIDKSSISSDSLTLVCDNTDISGTVLAVGPRLIFEPQDSLASSANCTATVGSIVLLADGSAAPRETWVFQAGSEQRSEMYFSDPKIFDVEGHYVMDMLYVQNRLIIAERNGDILYVTTTTDQGETLVRSDPALIYGSPVGSVIEAVTMAINDGVLNIFVTAGGPNSGPLESFLIQSANSALTSFRDPIHLPSVSPYSISLPSSVSIEDDGTLYRVWYEGCILGTTGAQCGFDVEGSYLQAFDAAGSSLSLEKIGPWEFKQPTVIVHEGTIYIAKTRDGTLQDNVGDPFIEIFNYSDGMRSLGEFGELGPNAQFNRFGALSDGRIVFSWVQSDLAEDEYRIYISYLDPVTDSLSPPHLASSKTTGGGIQRCGYVGIDEDGYVALVTELSEDIDASILRGVHFSTDFGLTFPNSIWSENLGSRYRRKIADKPFEQMCAFVAMGPDNVVHASWRRWYWDSVDGYMPQLVHNKGETVAPCSRPSWSAPP